MLTIQKAIDAFRFQWNLMAQGWGKRKAYERACEEFDIEQLDNADCFLCDYNSLKNTNSRKNTYCDKNCLIDWGANNCMKSGASFREWDFMYDPEDKRRRAAIVANEPVREKYRRYVC